MGCSSSSQAGALGDTPERIDLPFAQGDDRTAWRSCTALRRGADGFTSLRVDNTNEILMAKLEATEADSMIAELEGGHKVLARVGRKFQYETGTRLLVLQEGKLRDAEAMSWIGGNRHRLRMRQGDGAPTDVDLNQVNHCTQQMDSAETYEVCRSCFCARM